MANYKENMKKITRRFKKTLAQLKTFKSLSISDSKNKYFIILTLLIFEANSTDMNDMHFQYYQLKMQNDS